MGERDTGSVEVMGSSPTVSIMVNVIFLIIRKMAFFLNHSNHVVCRNADPDKEGLLVAKNEDQFSFKLVSGRKRPSMTCTTLLNGIQMGRPYKDETMEAWKRELMPEEGLEELAESGDEAAMNDLANAYLNGDGVEQDFEKSLYWWKKLAECDDPTGQYNVGLYYAKGCGVERDFEKATEWMRKSSENGDKDAEKLIDLFAKAGENLRKAETGDADAQAEVANLMMYLGRSVTVPGIDSEDEFRDAVKWAQKAADQDNVRQIISLVLKDWPLW